LVPWGQTDATRGGFPFWDSLWDLMGRPELSISFSRRSGRSAPSLCPILRRGSRAGLLETPAAPFAGESRLEALDKIPGTKRTAGVSALSQQLRRAHVLGRGVHRAPGTRAPGFVRCSAAQSPSFGRPRGTRKNGSARGGPCVGAGRCRPGRNGRGHGGTGSPASPRVRDEEPVD
jgi:hypothetical protein